MPMDVGSCVLRYVGFSTVAPISNFRFLEYLPVLLFFTFVSVLSYWFMVNFNPVCTWAVGYPGVSEYL